MSEEINPGDRFKGYYDGDEIKTENISDPYDKFNRNVFERDRDRVLYSRYLRRLKDVTQVARAGESYLYHDRLTHSIKVAQVGRRLAELLQRRFENSSQDKSPSRATLDPDVIETACLAHDMGHPPFGHLAEKELDKILQEYTHPEGDNEDFDPNKDDETAIKKGDRPGGIRYEGNAQSFRIATRLAAHSKAETGLGLTRATLNAILKYPYGRGEWVKKSDRSKGKFGYYKTEQKAFQFAREATPDGRDQAVTAQIMDYADDITYAIHDMTDFYKTGQIPLNLLLSDGRKLLEHEDSNPEEVSTPHIEPFEDYINKKVEASNLELVETSPSKVFEWLAESALGYPLLFEPFTGSQRQREHLDGFKSYLIAFYLDADSDSISEENWIQLKSEEHDYYLNIDKEIKEEIEILRELTFYYVIQDSSLMAQQHGQKRIIRTLFEELYDEAQKGNMNLSAIPKPYSEWVDGKLEGGIFEPPCNGRARAVADFISSMTEQQAIEMYKRITGHSPGALENKIIR